MSSIGLAADHAGFPLKNHIKGWLEQRGYQVHDYGTYSPESCDYPDFAHPLAQAVARGEDQLAFAFCGSANGMTITANKHRGVRCALCWQHEWAALARQHNDANICAMPARFLTNDEAERIAEAFLQSTFEGGRHLRRVQKIEPETY